MVLQVAHEIVEGNLQDVGIDNRLRTVLSWPVSLCAETKFAEGFAWLDNPDNHLTAGLVAAHDYKLPAFQEIEAVIPGVGGPHERALTIFTRMANSMIMGQVFEGNGSERPAILMFREPWGVHKKSGIQVPS